MNIDTGIDDIFSVNERQSIAYRPISRGVNKDALRGDTERGASQPVAAQMLHAGGEREGCSLDRGRGGVLQAPAAARRARAPAADARRVLLAPAMQTCSTATRITLHYTTQNTLHFDFYSYTVIWISRQLHFYKNYFFTF